MNLKTEKRMERTEAWLWVSVIRGAKAGDREALEMLGAENEARRSHGEPSVEEELREMAEEEEKRENWIVIGE